MDGSNMQHHIDRTHVNRYYNKCQWGTVVINKKKISESALYIHRKPCYIIEKTACKTLPKGKDDEGKPGGTRRLDTSIGGDKCYPGVIILQRECHVNDRREKQKHQKTSAPRS